ncbi:hypothetical protein AHF37_04574 [Paragonimus kellicotti]|nr:hypothetical protein AHF37_04574 [Paragonimus kellicotti]
MAKGRGIFWLFVLAAFVVTPFIFDCRDPLSFLRKGERLVNIDLAQLKKMQAANDIQLIDVREPVELEEAGRIPGATNIPFSFLRKGERLVNIDLAQLKKMQAANDIQLIDVREPVELEEAGRIPGATNIPLGDVEEAFLMDSETFLKTYNIKKPKKSDANIVFTCRSGVRSLRAVKIVEELGYK